MITFTFLLSDEKEAQVHRAKPAGPLLKPSFHLCFRSHWSGPGPRPRSPLPQALRPSAPAHAACLTSSTSLASAAALSPNCVYFLFAKLHLSLQCLGHQKPHKGTEGADVGLFLLSGFSLSECFG